LGENEKYVNHLEALTVQAEAALEEWRAYAKLESFQPQDKAELQSAIMGCSPKDGSGVRVFNNECYALNGKGNPVRMELWDVSKVTDFSDLFAGLSDFNVDVGEWTTDQATSMVRMFAGAAAFNQNLSSWNVWGVYNQEGVIAGTYMTDMFLGATSLDPANIAGWPNHLPTSAPTPKPTPQSTPAPTPKPTPQSTPAPTPAPTPQSTPAPTTMPPTTWQPTTEPPIPSDLQGDLSSDSQATPGPG